MEEKMAGVKRARAGDVGLLTLDEPSSLNAMTPDLLGDLAAAVDEMTTEPSVRALVLTGAGRSFCSGQNPKAFDSLGTDIVEATSGRRCGPCVNAASRSWSPSMV
jgi:2-(1,2-epoxy-1,2-dihydrophenyl)acetyl-CoA isomerase